jgi:hypothetical protein
LYRLNIRELGKLMTAMGGLVIAFKGINDFYHSRLATHDADGFNKGFAITRLGVAVQDVLSKTGLLGYGLGCVVIFKEQPSQVLLTALSGAGYCVLNLPRNPYT